MNFLSSRRLAIRASSRGRAETLEEINAVGNIQTVKGAIAVGVGSDKNKAVRRAIAGIRRDWPNTFEIVDGVNYINSIEIMRAVGIAGRKGAWRRLVELIKVIRIHRTAMRARY